jgi:hypothetical protein
MWRRSLPADALPLEILSAMGRAMLRRILVTTALPRHHEVELREVPTVGLSILFNTSSENHNNESVHEARQAWRS